MNSIRMVEVVCTNIKDPEVRELADKIIKAQEEEIAQMKELLERLEN